MNLSDSPLSFLIIKMHISIENVAWNENDSHKIRLKHQIQRSADSHRHLLSNLILELNSCFYSFISFHSVRFRFKPFYICLGIFRKKNVFRMFNHWITTEKKGVLCCVSNIFPSRSACLPFMESLSMQIRTATKMNTKQNHEHFY